MAIDSELRTEIERAVAAALMYQRAREAAALGALEAPKVQLHVHNIKKPTFGMITLDPTGAYIFHEPKHWQSSTEASSAPGQAPDDMKRLVRLVARAVEVLGTSEKALRWIDTPVRSLGDRTPLSLLDSPEGMVSVEDALGRIEHGVW